MPVTIEPRRTRGTARRTSAGAAGRAKLRSASASSTTCPIRRCSRPRAQFCGLLAGGGRKPPRHGCGCPPSRSCRARARGPAQRIDRSYWPIEDLLAEPPDALIVTGTEPRAARLSDEPYWPRFVELLAVGAGAHGRERLVVPRGTRGRRGARWNSAAASAAEAQRRLRAQHPGRPPAAAAGERATLHAALALERAAAGGAARGGLHDSQLVRRRVVRMPSSASVAACCSSSRGIRSTRAPRS